ncbi:hypothetical protein [Levilactobacillus andaensis]|uniref:hypothetical protein n=1 Tax=Levilactobacillus andaensis TaxID=2799570 RepID=UPI0019432508|nr:hypothetical protein [Levilactobacillus andaensis]
MSDETKEDKFRRLAERRTNDAISRIRLLGNLANRNNYEYSDQQVNEMFTAIDKELKQAKKKYDDELGNENKSFSFSKGR